MTRNHSRRSAHAGAATVLCLGLCACAHAASPARVAAPADGPSPADTVPASAPAPTRRGAGRATAAAQPTVAPAVAHVAGLMPLDATGINAFRRAHPTDDGRGVLIAVLDGGIDPSVPGLQRTTSGMRKLLDLRDLSGEGRVVLAPVNPSGGDTIRIGGRTLAGFGRVGRLSVGPFYGGVLREADLGPQPAADVNADGDAADQFPLVVARASDGWFLMTDTDGDGSLGDERPIYDYAVGADTFSYGRSGMRFAANLADSAGHPILDLFYDNSGHGTHVAGIAAGHNLFGIAGFDGVAPGAQVLGLKIADNTWGKISVSGSMAAALDTAAEYATRRGVPLVVNLSYGVGNEDAGRAVIDSVVDAFAVRHPGVLVVVSAGNDGPGISTVDFPASAELALTACALVPGVFARAPRAGVPPAAPTLGWWSARGGELAKPDLCAPGVAYSNVPPWRTGAEIAGGTSQAAPQLAGAAAVLQSAMLQEGRHARAIDLKRALMATAQPLPGASVLDQGAGVPDVPAAFDWLRAAHQAGVYLVQALPDGGNASRATAAFRRDGLASPGDTLQRFMVRTIGGQPAARLVLTADAGWLRAPREITLSGEPQTVTVTYDASQLGTPGVHVGSVWARAASDTLAGPVFRLTSTIVVPQGLSRPFRAQQMLSAGATQRYFLAVPRGAGGLRVAVTATAGRGALLYLFEPSGRSYRGENSVETVPGDTATGITVPGEDIVPGVYEADVVAPPGAGVTYTIEAALPTVAVRAIGTGPSAVLENRTADTCVVEVHGQVTGARRTFAVSGRDAPTWLSVPVPAWATQAVVDVSVPDSLWDRVTDFGLWLRDAAGATLSDEPLDYAAGRRQVALDPAARGRPLAIGLRPAFALGPNVAWRVDVRVTFLRAAPLPLLLPGGTSRAWLTLPGGETIALEFVPPGAPGDLPEGFAPLVAVTAQPREGPAAQREGVMPMGAEATP
jgi:subtilisin family serine protease